jgi:hypothetical protein
MIPDFSEALVEYRRFLREQERPDSMVWLFRDDVIRLGTVFVRVSAQDDGEAAARIVYERAAARQLGLELAEIAHDSERTYCAIEAPSDAQTAAAGNFSADDLKMSVVESPQELIIVRDRLSWQLVRLTARLKKRALRPSPYLLPR